MALCFVGIGSNVEREYRVRTGVAALRQRFGPLLLSAVYETAAVGFSGAPFYNLVAAFASDKPARAVAAALADIERAHGRVRADARFGPRTLDLDLLLYGTTLVHEPELTLPRSEIAQHAFILEPLAEIAPDLQHPETGRRYIDLWRGFEGERGGKKLGFDVDG